MLYFVIAISALALCEVITAAFMIVGMAKLSDCRKDIHTLNDVINIVAGSVAENRGEIKGMKKELAKNYGITSEKIPIIREERTSGNYICESCTYGPPSSLSGKPCCACDPEDPLMNCYQAKERVESA